MFEYDIYADKQLTYIRLSGDVTGNVVASAARKVREDRSWEDGMDVIWDWNGANSISISPDELDGMVLARTATKEGIDVGVVDHKEHAKSIERLLKALANRRGKEAKLFSTREQAIAWLEEEADGEE